MKKRLGILFLLLSTLLSAQDSEELAVKKAIDTFFEAFHAQDAAAMAATVQSNVIVQTIIKGPDERPKVETEGFQELVAHITRIPDSVAFQEKLLDYKIQVDGPMAHAWTPYEFWYQGAFHHCGVNSFQLFKEKDTWQIIYLIDTRREEDCGKGNN
jgi:hypothetical protein